MALTDKQRGAAWAGFGLTVAAIVAAVVIPEKAINRRHSKIPWGDGGKPGQVECVRLTGYASPGMRDLFGLDADGGYQYVHTVHCYDPDGGSGAVLDGVVTIEDTQVVIPGGDYRTQVWMQGEADGFPCACSPGDSCEVLLMDGGWTDAPKSGSTIEEGYWRGSGCIPKTCVELSGFPSMPDQCLP